MHRALNSLLWDATVDPPAFPTQQTGYNSGFLEGFAREAVWLGKFTTREQAGRAADLAALKLLGSNAQVSSPQVPACLSSVDGVCVCMWRSNIGASGVDSGGVLGEGGESATNAALLGCPATLAAKNRFLPCPLQLNFPREGYLSQLPALDSHSGEEVVAAIRKEAALAACRSSRQAGGCEAPLRANTEASLSGLTACPCCHHCRYKGVRRVGPSSYEARLPPPSAQPAPATGHPVQLDAAQQQQPEQAPEQLELQLSDPLPSLELPYV